MLFHAKSQNTPNCKLTIGDEVLDLVKSTKFWGIYINDGLKWNKHVEHCRKKITSGLYAMNAAKHTLTSNNLCILYNSLILPYLNFGTILWGNTYQKYMYVR